MLVFGWLCLGVTIALMIVGLIMTVKEALQSYRAKSDTIVIIAVTILLIGLISLAVATVPFTIAIV